MTANLHADAAAISDQSPAIKKFAQDVADILQPVTPTPPNTMPRQGVSAPLGNITGRSSQDEDWYLDQVVSLGNGHPMFLRTDWWPGNAAFQALAPKVAGRPSLVLMPILNYDAGNRPTAAVFASQAAQLAGLGFRYVNLLNEPNLGGWTAQDAAAYTKAAYTAIAGKALVVGPSVGFNGNLHGQTPAGVKSWIDAYHSAGGRQDIGGATCYGDAQYIDPVWNGWSAIPAIKATLGGPFIVLEGGWKVTGGSLTPYKRQNMTDAAYQAICVQTGMGANVDSFLAYSLLNDASPGGYGLLDNARAKRPAYTTFEQAAR